MDLSDQFDVGENGVLDALYEVQDGAFDSYTLFKTLNPTIQDGTPAAGQAFAKVREATERLIAKSLVRGQRLTGADGVWFRKLKLTPEGERTAIEFRNKRERAKRDMGRAQKETDNLAE